MTPALTFNVYCRLHNNCPPFPLLRSSLFVLTCAAGLCLHLLCCQPTFQFLFELPRVDTWCRRIIPFGRLCGYYTFFQYLLVFFFFFFLFGLFFSSSSALLPLCVSSVSSFVNTRFLYLRFIQLSRPRDATISISAVKLDIKTHFHPSSPGFSIF